MLALVTGAAGFIGSTLCRELLNRGWSVKGIDSFTDYYPRPMKEANLAGITDRRAFSFIEADLLEVDCRELVRDVGAVFHLAAQAGVRASWGTEFDHYCNTNILATQRLLEAAKEAGTERFVFASSSSVYGDSLALPTKEDAPLKPVSPYGVSKAAGDNLCRLYFRNFGLHTVALRYFTVYGPGQRPDMAFHRFLKAISLGEEIRLFGDGSQSRDFTYVDDIVAGTIGALEGRPGQAYNIGGDRNIVLSEVIEMMEDIIGREARINYLETAAGDVRHTSADIASAASDFGYRAATDLREGLTRELAWLKSVYLF